MPAMQSHPASIGRVFFRVYGMNSQASCEVVAGEEQLGVVLAESRAQAVDQWGDLGLDEHQFAEALGSHVAKFGAETSLLEQIATLRLNELFLVFGCLRGNRRALTLLEQRYISQLRIPSYGSSQIERDDLLQSLRAHLMVGHTARLIRYAGRGPLKAWLWRTARRLCLSFVRRARRSSALFACSLGDIDDLCDGSGVVKIDSRIESRGLCMAMVEGIQGLPYHYQEAIRLCWIEGYTHREIGDNYNVHQTTVTRWLDDARRELLRSHHAPNQREGVASRQAKDV